MHLIVYMHESVIKESIPDVYIIHTAEVSVYICENRYRGYWLPSHLGLFVAHPPSSLLTSNDFYFYYPLPLLPVTEPSLSIGLDIWTN